MGRTERAFYHALAALVFAAVCAWSLAALYTLFDRSGEEKPVPEVSDAPAACRFCGLLIRHEQRLPAGAFPGTKAGMRLNAADTGTESALFFPECDGWEGLSPEDALRLTPGGLERLLSAAPPEPEEGPRLVYGFTLLLGSGFCSLFCCRLCLCCLDLSLRRLCPAVCQSYDVENCKHAEKKHQKYSDDLSALFFSVSCCVHLKLYPYLSVLFHSEKAGGSL